MGERERVETKRAEAGGGKTIVDYISIQYKVMVTIITVGRKKKREALTMSSHLLGRKECNKEKNKRRNKRRVE